MKYAVNQKKIDFHKLGRYTKNPAIPNPSINLQKKVQKIFVGQDSQMNEPLKSRGRIMSERLNEDDDDEIEIRRKNTEMAVEDDKIRKCSMISNLSNASNIPLSEQYDECLPELEQEIEEKVNENQQFLDNDRFKIVELIRNRKILEAIDLMKSRIPSIFEESYLMAFMNAHVFLQKIKDQSSKQAVIFSRKQSKTFHAHTGTLMPFYDPQLKTCEWVPLSSIFEGLAYNAQIDCKLSKRCRNMLSDSQFHAFANYINQLILNKMGYLACSRLTYYTGHMKKIQDKIKELKGMNCGIEFRA